jgi:hypothetical protein
MADEQLGAIAVGWQGELSTVENVGTDPSFFLL